MRTRTRKYNRESKATSHHGINIKHRRKKSTKKTKLLYTEKKNYQKKQTRPTPVKDDSLLYEVEKVIDARQGRLGPEYLVKWEGYSSKHNSWIDDIPSFFKKKCLVLIGNIGKSVGDIRGGVGTAIDGSDNNSSDDSEIDSDPDSAEDTASDT
jgi:hypothetical protein